MPSPPLQDVRNGRKAKSSLFESRFFETLSRFWQKSYAGDYLAVVLLALARLLLKLFGEPFHQLFLLSDTRLQHPHAELQRVDVFWLMLCAVGVPVVVLLLWNLLWKPDMHKTHVTILGLAGSVLLTAFVTDVIKDAVGRPRPDLIARCQPETSAHKNGFVGIEICTETRHHVLHDGWRSFPSGHSSFAFAGLGWLSLFFASQTHLFRPRASLLTVLFCLLPLLGAALIGVSRLEDYRHDVGDVICGSILGLLAAYLNWRRFYPGLMEKFCDEPHSPPLSGSGRSSPSGVGFQRVRDEEEVYSLGEEDGGGGGYSRGANR